MQVILNPLILLLALSWVMALNMPSLQNTSKTS